MTIKIPVKLDGDGEFEFSEADAQALADGLWPLLAERVEDVCEEFARVLYARLKDHLGAEPTQPTQPAQPKPVAPTTPKPRKPRTRTLE